MTAAVLGLAAMFTGALVGVITMALKALSAERRAGEQKARGDVGDVNQTALATMLSDMTNQRNEEKARVARLRKALAGLQAQIVSGPVNGSAARLLQAIATATAEDDHDSRELPEPVSADTSAPRDSDLLRPGE